MKFLTRDDIDQQGSTLGECRARELELIAKYGLGGKPKEIQESLCPELAIVRERSKRALTFIEKYN